MSKYILTLQYVHKKGFMIFSRKSNQLSNKENTMKQFIDKYQKNIIGSISGWDRIAWRGTNRWLSNCDGLGCYLSMNHILLKDFKGWALDITGKLRESCDALADIWGIRKEYLRSSSVNKEELARRIAKEDGITYKITGESNTNIENNLETIEGNEKEVIEISKK